MTDTTDSMFLVALVILTITGLAISSASHSSATTDAVTSRPAIQSGR